MSLVGDEWSMRRLVSQRGEKEVHCVAGATRSWRAEEIEGMLSRGELGVENRVTRDTS